MTAVGDVAVTAPVRPVAVAAAAAMENGSRPWSDEALPAARLTWEEIANVVAFATWHSRGLAQREYFE